MFQYMGAGIYFYFNYHYSRVWYNTCHTGDAKNERMLNKQISSILLKRFYSDVISHTLPYITVVFSYLCLIPLGASSPGDFDWSLQNGEIGVTCIILASSGVYLNLSSSSTRYRMPTTKSPKTSATDISQKDQATTSRGQSKLRVCSWALWVNCPFWELTGTVKRPHSVLKYWSIFFLGVNSSALNDPLHGHPGYLRLSPGPPGSPQGPAPEGLMSCLAKGLQDCIHPYCLVPACHLCITSLQG